MKIKYNKYKNSLGWGVRVYKSFEIYPKFEALLIKLGHRGLWFFRNQEVLNSWPSTQ